MFRFLCEHNLSAHSSEYQGMWLLGPAVFLVLEETVKLHPKVAVPFCIPTRNEQEFLLFHILARIWCFQRYSNICAEISQSWFNLHFPNDMWYGAIGLFPTCISSLESSILKNMWSCKFWLRYESTADRIHQRPQTKYKYLNEFSNTSFKPLNHSLHRD